MRLPSHIIFIFNRKFVVSEPTSQLPDIDHFRFYVQSYEASFAFMNLHEPLASSDRSTSAPPRCRRNWIGSGRDGLLLPPPCLFLELTSRFHSCSVWTVQDPCNSCVSEYATFYVYAILERFALRGSSLLCPLTNSYCQVPCRSFYTTTGCKFQLKFKQNV